MCCGRWRERQLVSVALSITTLDAELARTLEPRTATPAARLRAIRELAAAGVPVRVMLAPVVPGLTDNEIPAILRRPAKEAGAGAGYVHAAAAAGRRADLYRLARGARPLAADAGRVADSRDARRQALRSRWGERMRGSGPYAEGIAKTFEVFSRKLGLDAPWQPLDTSQFRAPSLDPSQAAAVRVIGAWVGSLGYDGRSLRRKTMVKRRTFCDNDLYVAQRIDGGGRECVNPRRHLQHSL